MFFGKTISRPFRQKWAKFSFMKISPRIVPHNSFGPENRWKGWFRKNRPEMLFLFVTILPHSAPYSLIGPKNRWGGRFCKSGLEMCFSEIRFQGLFRQKRAKFSSVATLPQNAPHSLFGPENRWRGLFRKNGTETCFMEKRFRGCFRQKWAKFFVRYNFALKTHHIIHLAPKIGEGAVL